MKEGRVEKNQGNRMERVFFAGEFPLQAAGLIVLLLGQCQTLLSSWELLKSDKQ